LIIKLSVWMAYNLVAVIPLKKIKRHVLICIIIVPAPPLAIRGKPVVIGFITEPDGAHTHTTSAKAQGDNMTVEEEATAGTASVLEIRGSVPRTVYMPVWQRSKRMDNQNSKRVRINAVQDAKGYFKLDVTAEVENVDGDDPVALAGAMLTRAIRQARIDMSAAGLKWLADPAVNA
jgi:hypothetical protein